MPIDSRKALLTFAAAVALAACALAQDTARPAWIIAIDGGADDHGEIVLSFAEGGVEVTQISAAIPKGTRENNVAQRVEGALERALAKSQYEVDRKGGERIVVAALDPAKDFEIRLVRNTAPGTEVSVVREQPSQ